MMKTDKKLLMVCSTFYPESNPRAVQCYELYRALKKRGYYIELCIPPRHKVYDEKSVAELLETHMLEKKTFVNTRQGFSGFISKVVCYFIGQKGFYIYNSWLDRTINLSDYKAVIAIAAPFYNIYTVSRLLKRQGKIKAICDNGDPFYQPGLHSIFVRQMQIKAFKYFDYICFPIEKAYNYYSKFADESKLRVIPQGRNLENIKLKKYVKNKITTFGYAGCFFMDIRNPEFFLKLLANIEEPFKFILYTETVGDVYEKVLIKYKGILGSKMEIHDFIPRTECIYELSGMDFLINFENNNLVQSPSKLIDYSLTGRPILSVKEGEKNEDLFLDFMNNKFGKATKIELENYDINKIADKYTAMIEGDDI